MISVASTFLDEIPGEAFLTKHLQTPVLFTLGKKIIKQGKLVLFKRVHYYIQITLLTSKSNRESFEIPIPFKTEEYSTEGLIYFDYRLISLMRVSTDITNSLNKIRFKNISPSQYYDKILEIQAKNT